MEELISIIIPVYNVGSYLDRCIQSVCNQTYKNLEIILIDDGSTDGSAEICDIFEKEDRRIRVVHQNNLGVYAARNVGLDRCTGEYVCFVDSDDCLALHMVELLYCALQKSNADISVCSCYIVKNERIFISHFQVNKKIYSSGEAFLHDVFKIRLLNILCGKLYRRVLFQNVRFLLLPSHGDLPVWISLCPYIKRVILMDEPAYYYIRRNGSITKPRRFDLDKFSYMQASRIVFDYFYHIEPSHKNIGDMVYYISIGVTLRHIYLCRAEHKYAQEVKAMRYKLLSDKYHILNNRYIPFFWKIAFCIAMYIPILFSPAYKFYMFIFGRHEL